MESKWFYEVSVLFVLFVMIFITRALPFWVGNAMRHNERIKIIGRYLPAYMMMLLVVFEVHPKNFFHWPFAIPALVGLLALTLVHFWKRQVLLSIVVGVGIYFFVNYILSL